MPAPQVLAQLLRQLDDEKFAVRERAVEELTRIGPAIVPDMEKLSRDSPSAEVRSRARSIVEEFRLRNGFVIESEDQLRAYRAIQVLEQLGTPEADQLLKRLAGGAPGRQTIETKLALERRGATANQ
jgi:HEAT repeat protein